jgi:hypothetical protein
MIKQRSLLKFILLGIITLGIYDIVFLYGWTKDNNRLCEGVGKDSPNYIAVLLLSMITFGIYGLYWYFKMGDRLQQAAPKYGLSFQHGGTTVLLWMVIGSLLCGIGPFIAMYYLIDHQNQLATAYNVRLAQGDAPEQPQA